MSTPVSLVLGASGAIGRFLLPRLLRAEHRVFALSRKPQTEVPRLHWLTGDLFAAVPGLPRLDAIFSLGPLDGLAHWLAQAHFSGHPCVIAFGSTSIHSKRNSPDPDERALVERLQQAENAMIAAAAQRGCAWTLLRPTLIYGAGLDRSLTPLARAGMRWRVFPRLPDAVGLRQPVHAEDLASVCIRALHSARGTGRRYTLGGAERLSFYAMLERVRRSLPVATLPLPLPLAAARVAVAGARALGWRQLTVMSVARLQTDLIADNAAAESDLGWTPRSFEPDESCWSPPSLP